MNFCGYLIVRLKERFPMKNLFYCGVDRLPFWGEGDEDDESPILQKASNKYDENLFTPDESVEFINRYSAAIEILQLLDSMGRDYEIIKCRVDRNVILKEDSDTKKRLGIDIAYFGGDYFSMIYNSFCSETIDDSLQPFFKELNEYGLFNDMGTATRFFNQYNQLESSEEGDFCFYRIETPK